MDDALKKVIDEQIAPLVTDQTKYLAGAQQGIAVARADLHYVYDQYGTQLLDFSTTMNPAGHRHPFVDRAIREHLDYYLYTAPVGEHVLRWPVEYAKALVDTFTPEDEEPTHQVLFTEGERDARVQAKALARHNMKSHLVVRLENDHGGLADEQWVTDTVEHAKGTGTIAVVIDERHTGFGRLGAMWGQQAYGVEADLTVLGGPLGGGMALGAVIARTEWFEGYKGVPSVQAGSPLACAAGVNLLRAINPGVVEHAGTTGQMMAGELKALAEQFPEYLGATHGRGLWQTIEFHSIELANTFTLDARRHGLLVAPPLPGTSSVVLTPTLIASDIEVRRGINMIGAVFLEWYDKDNQY